MGTSAGTATPVGASPTMTPHHFQIGDRVRIVRPRARNIAEVFLVKHAPALSEISPLAAWGMREDPSWLPAAVQAGETSVREANSERLRTPLEWARINSFSARPSVSLRYTHADGVVSIGSWRRFET